MLNAISTFISSTRQYGVKVGWHNFRFELGYWIGGFVHARTCCNQSFPCSDCAEMEL